jgi:hypothetical protein
MKNINRRAFLNYSVKALSFGAVISLVGLNNKLWAAPGKLLVIDMSEKKRKDADNKQCVGIAKGLGYVENLDAALKSKKTVKETRTFGAKTFKPIEQNCSTCQFYDYKKDGQPTCQLLPKCLVHDIGSCNSWVPKA